MKAKTTTWQAPTDDNNRLSNLCGPLDSNLREIEKAFEVKISRRGASLALEGKAPGIAQAIGLLDHFFVQSRLPLEPQAIQLATVEMKNTHTLKSRQAPTVVLNDEENFTLKTRKGELQARSQKQRQYLAQVLQHDLTFGIGPAGTGKTYLAVACAIDALERDKVNKIILTRPAVEAGERLGFLPGDLGQKLDPYLRPLYDALYELAGFDRVQKWFERNAIEIAPLAYMRGRTLSEAFIILDEAQNTTPEQMKMFLTRIGFGSKAVITGDVTQIDLPSGQKSGLVQAQQVLQGVSGIAVTYFESADVVRHPLVARIVDAYDRFNHPGKSPTP
ncbi:MAG: PhoH family protein [Limnobacter sp.]|nr:PhoH family protein [Limnobacter sp.]